MVDEVELRQRLEALTAHHGVPGASLAVLADGYVTTAAAGVLHVETKVPVTDESLFQIGSITKIYTATLLMQLVDEGRLELDVPVVAYLPEVALPAAGVTVRHLLSHTSGLAGDHFPDLGRGDEVLESFVRSCAALVPTHPLGATFSYCNAGFVIAGRLVERLVEQRWDDALASRLVAPLGLQHTVTLPEDALRFRSALGHSDIDGRARPVQKWGLPRAIGPAGLICATAADVIAFARMHLDSGRAVDGTRVLSSDSVRIMQEAQVELPDPYTFGSHWGLGWMLFDCDGRPVIGHDGGTIGQASCLRAVPDAGVAVVVLVNGGHALDLFEDLVRPLLQELAAVRLPRRLEPPPEPVHVDVDRYTGTYERLGTRIEVASRDGRLMLRSRATGDVVDIAVTPVTEHELVPVRPDLFVTREPGTVTWNPVVFFRLDDGARYLHHAGRATPLVGAA